MKRSHIWIFPVVVATVLLALLIGDVVLTLRPKKPKAVDLLVGGRYDFIPEELFLDLNKSKLLNESWVPLSCDENGVEVLVDDPSDTEKKAIIKATLITIGITFAVGIKEDIQYFINQFFDQIEIYDLVSAARSGERPIGVKKIVDIDHTCLIFIEDVLETGFRHGAAAHVFAHIEQGEFFPLFPFIVTEIEGSHILSAKTK